MVDVVTWLMRARRPDSRGDHSISPASSGHLSPRQRLWIAGSGTSMLTVYGGTLDAAANNVNVTAHVFEFSSSTIRAVLIGSGTRDADGHG